MNKTLRYGIALAATLALILLGSLARETPIKRSGQFPNVVPVGGIPTFNVRTYGAVGDGVTDDRVAITNAITAACASSSPAVVFFPGGNYVVSRNGSTVYSLNIPCSNVSLEGIQYKSRIMHPSGMPNTSVNIIYIDQQSHVAFRNLIIDGNWQNAVGIVSNTSDGATLPQATINLDDASFFPSGGGAYTILASAGLTYVSCTGKTATSLTGCTGGSGTLRTRTIVGYVDAPAGINHATQTTVSSTIAVGSNGAALPQATINIVDSTAFTNGTANIWIKTSVGYQRVTCTGAASNQLTGCTGGTGTLSTGNEVFPSAAAQGRNNGISISGSTQIDIQDVVFQRIYGDCIYMGVGSNKTWAQDIRVSRVDCNIASRNALTFGSATKGVVIDGFRTSSISAQAIDAEPVWWPVRDIKVTNSYLAGWWNNETHDVEPMSIAGSSTASQIESTDARNWRVENNTLEGTVFISNATDVVFDGNKVIQDYSNDSPSPIIIKGFVQDITVSHNYVYTRSTTSGSDGQDDCCGILVVSYIYGGGIYADPTSVHIFDNHVHVRNGRYGISVVGAGGGLANATGTATAVTSSTLTDSGASWTTNQWTGAKVRVGNTSASVASNTATVLTLNTSYQPSSTSWTNVVGNQADTPSPGAYTITRRTGLVSVSNNSVEASDDGYGRGKYCINVSSGNGNAPNLRVRVHNNDVRDCDTDAIHLKFDGTKTFPYVEITDNFAHDDQITPTTTNVVGVTNTIRATKFMLGGNIAGEGVTNLVSGLSSGTWLTKDGLVKEFAGYGSPESVVTAPVGSTYKRVDGGTTTSSYVKTSGSGNTGWLASALSGSSPTFTGATIGSTILSTTTPSVNHGSLGTGSTNWWGNVTGVGANTSVVLTYGGGGFASRSWCSALPNQTTTPEIIVVTNSATAPTFSCFNSTTGLAANCDDFTYECAGQ